MNQGISTVLLVGVNPNEAQLVQEALQAPKAPNRVEVAADGGEAMALLRREGSYAGAHRPRLIVLDLALPQLDGEAVLAELKTDAQFGYIPVVILTASDGDEDITRAYQMHANAYIIKPASQDKYLAAVRAIGIFWLDVVTLPPDGWH